MPELGDNNDTLQTCVAEYAQGGYWYICGDTELHRDDYLSRPKQTVGQELDEEAWRVIGDKNKKEQRIARSWPLR
jgi:hypothetical protein